MVGSALVIRTPSLALLLVALLALGVVGMAVACAGDESEEFTAPEFSPSSPIIESVLSRMASLSSYHVTITASPPPQDPLRTGRAELDLVAPDSFRVIASEADGETNEVCTTEMSDGSSSRTCIVVLTAVTGNDILEGAWNGKAMFLRECTDAIEACGGAWLETSNGKRLAPSAIPLEGADMPNWHLEALKAARDLVLVQDQGTPGMLLHYRGRFNPVRVSNEAGRKFFGEEVYGDEGFSEDEDCGVTGSVGMTPGCGSRRGDLEKEQIEAYDASPAPIDIWVSSTDSTIQRILAVTPQLPGYPEITVDLVFSQFNEVEIEFPPKE
jgi:hypothetical protein